MMQEYKWSSSLSPSFAPHSHINQYTPTCHISTHIPNSDTTMATIDKEISQYSQEVYSTYHGLKNEEDKAKFARDLFSYAGPGMSSLKQHDQFRKALDTTALAGQMTLPAHRRRYNHYLSNVAECVFRALVNYGSPSAPEVHECLDKCAGVLKALTDLITCDGWPAGEREAMAKLKPKMKEMKDAAAAQNGAAFEKFEKKTSCGTM